METCRISIPAFEHVGLCTAKASGVLETRAATSELARRLDLEQFSRREGPSVDAMHGAPLQSVPHLRREQRWPGFVAEAVANGLESQIAVRLHLEGVGTLGCLNLYSTVAEEVESADIEMAELFATHAAVALGNAQHGRDLSRALESRTQIGVAVGIVMNHYRMSQAGAFAYLVRASSHSNTKIRVIADEIVTLANRAGETGERLELPLA